MRQTGKTTRLVDIAIQHLFKTGNLKIYEVHHGRSDFNDVDATQSNKANIYFIESILRRLSFEHPETVNVEKHLGYVNLSVSLLKITNKGLNSKKEIEQKEVVFVLKKNNKIEDFKNNLHNEILIELNRNLVSEHQVQDLTKTWINGIEFEINNKKKFLNIDYLENEEFDVDFNGEFMIRLKKKIINSNLYFEIVNAMNGYGQNCLNEMKDYKVNYKFIQII